MAIINNIFNMQNNQVTESGSVNFGNTFHLGQDNAQKSLGGSLIAGDFAINIDMEKNINIDPDVVDQSNIKAGKRPINAGKRTR